MQKHKGKCIVVAGSAMLVSNSQVTRKSTNNQHTGAVGLGFGGNGYNIAKNLKVRENNVVVLTAYKEGSFLNPSFKAEFDGLNIRTRVQYSKKLPEPMSSRLFGDDIDEVSVNQEMLCHYDFETSFLECSIKKAKALFITTEFSNKSFQDAISIAKSSRIPVFVASYHEFEVQRIDFDKCDIDYLFVTDNSIKELAKKYQQDKLNKLAKLLDTTIVLISANNSIQVVDSNSSQTYQFDDADSNNYSSDIEAHIMSACSYYISIGYDMLEAIELTMEEVEYSLVTGEVKVCTNNKLSDTLLKITKSANKDYLTGIMNRQGLHNALGQLNFEKYCYATCLIDIDHFKMVNDTFGHSVGDDMLKFLTKTLKLSIRDEDLFARWGGEEFILILALPKEHKCTDLAASILDRLRKKINKVKHKELNGNAISVSIGAKWLNSIYDFSVNCDLADQALYQAKETGRNRVVFNDSED